MPSPRIPVIPLKSIPLSQLESLAYSSDPLSQLPHIITDQRQLNFLQSFLAQISLEQAVETTIVEKYNASQRFTSAYESYLATSSRYRNNQVSDDNVAMVNEGSKARRFLNPSFNINHAKYNVSSPLINYDSQTATSFDFKSLEPIHQYVMLQKTALHVQLMLRQLGASRDEIGLFNSFHEYSESSLTVLASYIDQVETTQAQNDGLYTTLTPTPNNIVDQYHTVTLLMQLASRVASLPSMNYLQSCDLTSDGSISLPTDEDIDLLQLYADCSALIRARGQLNEIARQKSSQQKDVVNSTTNTTLQHHFASPRLPYYSLIVRFLATKLAHRPATYFDSPLQQLAKTLPPRSVVEQAQQKFVIQSDGSMPVLDDTVALPNWLQQQHFNSTLTPLWWSFLTTFCCPTLHSQTPKSTQPIVGSLVDPSPAGSFESYDALSISTNGFNLLSLAALPSLTALLRASSSITSPYLLPILAHHNNASFHISHDKYITPPTQKSQQRFHSSFSNCVLEFGSIPLHEQLSLSQLCQLWDIHSKTYSNTLALLLSANVFLEMLTSRSFPQHFIPLCQGRDVPIISSQLIDDVSTAACSTRVPLFIPHPSTLATFSSQIPSHVLTAMGYFDRYIRLLFSMYNQLTAEHHKIAPEPASLLSSLIKRKKEEYYHSSLYQQAEVRVLKMLAIVTITGMNFASQYNIWRFDWCILFAFFGTTLSDSPTEPCTDFRSSRTIGALFWPQDHFSSVLQSHLEMYYRGLILAINSPTDACPESLLQLGVSQQWYQHVILSILFTTSNTVPISSSRHRLADIIFKDELNIHDYLTIWTSKKPSKLVLTVDDQVTPVVSTKNNHNDSLAYSITHTSPWLLNTVFTPWFHYSQAKSIYRSAIKTWSGVSLHITSQLPSMSNIKPQNTVQAIDFISPELRTLIQSNWLDEQNPFASSSSPSSITLGWKKNLFLPDFSLSPSATCVNLPITLSSNVSTLSINVYALNLSQFVSHFGDIGTAANIVSGLERLEGLIPHSALNIPLFGQHVSSDDMSDDTTAAPTVTSHSSALQILSNPPADLSIVSTPYLVDCVISLNDIPSYGLFVVEVIADDNVLHCCLRKGRYSALTKKSSSGTGTAFVLFDQNGQLVDNPCIKIGNDSYSPQPQHDLKKDNFDDEETRVLQRVIHIPSFASRQELILTDSQGVCATPFSLPAAASVSEYRLDCAWFISAETTMPSASIVADDVDPQQPPQPQQQQDQSSTTTSGSSNPDIVQVNSCPISLSNGPIHIIGGGNRGAEVLLKPTLFLENQQIDFQETTVVRSSLEIVAQLADGTRISNNVHDFNILPQQHFLSSKSSAAGSGIGGDVVASSASASSSTTSYTSCETIHAFRVPDSIVSISFDLHLTLRVGHDQREIELSSNYSQSMGSIYSQPLATLLLLLRRVEGLYYVYSVNKDGTPAPFIPLRMVLQSTLPRDYVNANSNFESNEALDSAFFTDSNGCACLGSLFGVDRVVIQTNNNVNTSNSPSRNDAMASFWSQLPQVELSANLEGSTLAQHKVFWPSQLTIIASQQDYAIYQQELQYVAQHGEQNCNKLHSTDAFRNQCRSQVQLPMPIPLSNARVARMLLFLWKASSAVSNPDISNPLFLQWLIDSNLITLRSHVRHHDRMNSSTLIAPQDGAFLRATPTTITLHNGKPGQTYMIECRFLNNAGALSTLVTVHHAPLEKIRQYTTTTATSSTTTTPLLFASRGQIIPSYGWLSSNPSRAVIWDNLITSSLAPIPLHSAIHAQALPLPSLKFTPMSQTLQIALERHHPGQTFVAVFASSLATSIDSFVNTLAASHRQLVTAAVADTVPQNNSSNITLASVCLFEDVSMSEERIYINHRRQEQDKHPFVGNMLPQASLLLNKRFCQFTEATADKDKKKAKLGSIVPTQSVNYCASIAPCPPPAACPIMRNAHFMSRRAPMNSQYNMNDLFSADILRRKSLLFCNIPVSDDGSVELISSSFSQFAQLTVVVYDIPESQAQRILEQDNIDYSIDSLVGNDLLHFSAQTIDIALAASISNPSTPNVIHTSPLLPATSRDVIEKEYNNANFTIDSIQQPFLQTTQFVSNQHMDIQYADEHRIALIPPVTYQRSLASSALISRVVLGPQATTEFNTIESMPKLFSSLQTILKTVSSTDNNIYDDSRSSIVSTGPTLPQVAQASLRALRRFAFTLEWQQGVLTLQQKLQYLQRFGCHELHIWIFFHDRAFFETTLRLQLANKLEYSIVDFWLLAQAIDVHSPAAIATDGELLDTNNPNAPPAEIFSSLLSTIRQDSIVTLQSYIASIDQFGIFEQILILSVASPTTLHHVIETVRNDIYLNRSKNKQQRSQKYWVEVFTACLRHSLLELDAAVAASNDDDDNNNDDSDDMNEQESADEQEEEEEEEEHDFEVLNDDDDDSSDTSEEGSSYPTSTMNIMQAESFSAMPMMRRGGGPSPAAPLSFGAAAPAAFGAALAAPGASLMSASNSLRSRAAPMAKMQPQMQQQQQQQQRELSRGGDIMQEEHRSARKTRSFGAAAAPVAPPKPSYTPLEKTSEYEEASWYIDDDKIPLSRRYNRDSIMQPAAALIDHQCQPYENGSSASSDPSILASFSQFWLDFASYLANSQLYNVHNDNSTPEKTNAAFASSALLEISYGAVSVNEVLLIWAVTVLAPAGATTPAPAAAPAAASTRRGGGGASSRGSQALQKSVSGAVIRKGTASYLSPSDTLRDTLDSNLYTIPTDGSADSIQYATVLCRDVYPVIALYKTLQPVTTVADSSKTASSSSSNSTTSAEGGLSCQQYYLDLTAGMSARLDDLPYVNPQQLVPAHMTYLCKVVLTNTSNNTLDCKVLLQSPTNAHPTIIASRYHGHVDMYIPYLQSTTQYCQVPAHGSFIIGYGFTLSIPPRVTSRYVSPAAVVASAGAVAPAVSTSTSSNNVDTLRYQHRGASVCVQSSSSSSSSSSSESQPDEFVSAQAVTFSFVPIEYAAAQIDYSNIDYIVNQAPLIDVLTWIKSYFTPEFIHVLELQLHKLSQSSSNTAQNETSLASIRHAILVAQGGLKARQRHSLANHSSFSLHQLGWRVDNSHLSFDDRLTVFAHILQCSGELSSSLTLPGATTGLSTRYRIETQLPFYILGMELFRTKYAHLVTTSQTNKQSFHNVKVTMSPTVLRAFAHTTAIFMTSLRQQMLFGTNLPYDNSLKPLGAFWYSHREYLPLIPARIHEASLQKATSASSLLSIDESVTLPDVQFGQQYTSSLYATLQFATGLQSLPFEHLLSLTYYNITMHCNQRIFSVLVPALLTAVQREVSSLENASHLSDVIPSTARIQFAYVLCYIDMMATGTLAQSLSQKQLDDLSTFLQMPVLHDAKTIHQPSYCVTLLIARRFSIISRVVAKQWYLLFQQAVQHLTEAQLIEIDNNNQPIHTANDNDDDTNAVLDTTFNLDENDFDVNIAGNQAMLRSFTQDASATKEPSMSLHVLNQPQGSFLTLQLENISNVNKSRLEMRLFYVDTELLLSQSPFSGTNNNTDNAAGFGASNGNNRPATYTSASASTNEPWQLLAPHSVVIIDQWDQLTSSNKTPLTVPVVLPQNCVSANNNSATATAAAAAPLTDIKVQRVDNNSGDYSQHNCSLRFVIPPQTARNAYLELRLHDAENAADNDHMVTRVLAPLLHSALLVQAAYKQGIVSVIHAQTKSPILGVYVKCYAEQPDSKSARFHHDGYTDIRGKFDYASTSQHTTGSGAQKKSPRFSLIISHPVYGTTVLYVDQPTAADLAK